MKKVTMLAIIALVLHCITWVAAMVIGCVDVPYTTKGAFYTVNSLVGLAQNVTLICFFAILYRKQK